MIADASIDYNVGQVLFVVLRKETKVYPMQVVERVTRQTLEGEVITYMVRGGTDPAATLLITDIDGEIFDSATRVHQALSARAATSIAKLVDTAVAKAREWYPKHGNDIDDVHHQPAEVDPMILLKRAPASKPPPLPKRSRREVNAELAAELQQEADEIADDDANIIVLPDGSKAKVRSVKLSEAKQ